MVGVRLPAIPVTQTRLSHALTIRAGSRIIGAVHVFSSSQSRTIDQEYENEPSSSGLPRDLVPQTVDRREIRVARYDLYNSIMEEVFGSSEIVNLSDQFRPFSLREVWDAPGAGLGLLTNALGLTASAGLSTNDPTALFRASIANFDLETAVLRGASAIAAGSQPRQYEYLGCWFSDIGRPLDAKGDRTVSVDATIQYQFKKRLV